MRDRCFFYVLLWKNIAYPFGNDCYCEIHLSNIYWSQTPFLMLEYGVSETVKEPLSWWNLDSTGWKQAKPKTYRGRQLVLLRRIKQGKGNRKCFVWMQFQIEFGISKRIDVREDISEKGITQKELDEVRKWIIGFLEQACCRHVEQVSEVRACLPWWKIAKRLVAPAQWVEGGCVSWGNEAHFMESLRGFCTDFSVLLLLRQKSLEGLEQGNDKIYLHFYKGEDRSRDCWKASLVIHTHFEGGLDQGSNNGERSSGSLANPIVLIEFSD